MATVYKVEVVSHWINYTEEELKKILEKALHNEGCNEITVEVERV